METAQIVSKKRFYKRTWFWILIGVILVVMISSSGQSDQPSEPSNPTPSADYVMNSGEQGYIRNGQDEVLVSKTQTALDTFTKAAIAKDNVGMTEVVTSGQAYFVKAGTKVLVIERISGGVTKVRIQEGEFSGDAGYVPMEFVKKQ